MGLLFVCFSWFDWCLYSFGLTFICGCLLYVFGVFWTCVWLGFYFVVGCCAALVCLFGWFEIGSLVWFVTGQFDYGCECWEISYWLV